MSWRLVFVSWESQILSIVWVDTFLAPSVHLHNIKLENTVKWSWSMVRYCLFFLSVNKPHKPNCSISSTSAAELDSNLIWVYTDWQSSLFTSLYFGLLAMLWFVLFPISVVSFLSACLILFISIEPTTFLAATSFLVLCLCFYNLQYKLF